MEASTHGGAPSNSGFGSLFPNYPDEQLFNADTVEPMNPMHHEPPS
jgi:hypothetical protein